MEQNQTAPNNQKETGSSKETHAMTSSLSLEAFDGLRGLCCLLIVLGHFLSFYTPVWVKQDTSYPVFGLEYITPVSLFIIVSGFTLAHLYASASSVDFNTKLFLRKRIAHLAPLYYFGLLIGVPPLLYYGTGPIIYTSIPISLLCIQSLTLVGGLFWNGPLWTVSTLALCYICFPRIMKWLTTGKFTRTMAIVSVALLLNVLMKLNPITSLVSHAWVFFRLPQFVLGMAVCLAARACLTTGHETENGSAGIPKPFTRVISFVVSHATLTSNVCAVILILNMAACAIFSARDGNADRYFTYMNMSGAVLTPVLAAWLVSLASPECDSTTKRVLCAQPLRFLGSVSYSMYCIHTPVLLYCSWIATWSVSPWRTVQNIPGFFALPLWSVVPVTGLIVACAAVTRYAIEQPARELIGRGEKQRKTE